MKDFIDTLADTIIARERPRLDKIMKEVTDKIRDDFADVTMLLLDRYYDDYTPLYYVRIYEPKRKRPRKRPNAKPRKGTASLYGAVQKGLETSDKVAVSGGSYETGYVGGVSFNPDYFARYNMKHYNKGAGFKDWNIIENFIYAGEGVADYGDALVGDWRSTGQYDGVESPSFDLMMDAFMSGYGSTIDKYYNDALRKNK